MVFTRDADPTDAAFPDDRLIEVEVTLDPADWATLREQGREFNQLCDVDVDPYDWFNATVTVDGVSYDIRVRKKGFYGSLDSTRPSLKLRFEDDAGPHGVSRMTLNNDRQDPSHLRQCLGYGVFAAAGVPAPRCALAHVTVNGEDMGIYTSIDAIKKPFLSLYFDDNDGSLYEGQVGDFTLSNLPYIESKTDELPGRERLEAIQQALALEDSGAAVRAVGRLVDIDAFLTFWATEVLVGHFDGYANNQNNWYAYHDPTSDLVYFLPWGADAVFTGNTDFINQGNPRAAFFTGRLTQRLYEHEPTRARYVRRLETLLDSVYDEDALMAEADRLVGIMGARADADAVQGVRDVIRTTRLDLEAELRDGLPDRSFVSEGDPRACPTASAQLDVTFDTTFGTLTSMDIEQMRATVQWDSVEPLINHPPEFDAHAGYDDITGMPTVRIIGLRPNFQLVVLALIVDPVDFVTGVMVPTEGFRTFGIALQVTFTAGGPAFRQIGVINDGMIWFDEVNETDGGRVAGGFSATLYTLE